jgi:hypothetical protein
VNRFEIRRRRLRADVIRPSDADAADATQEAFVSASRTGPDARGALRFEILPSTPQELVDRSEVVREHR